MRILSRPAHHRRGGRVLGVIGMARRVRRSGMADVLRTRGRAGSVGLMARGGSARRRRSTMPGMGIMRLRLLHAVGITRSFVAGVDIDRRCRRRVSSRRVLAVGRAARDEDEAGGERGA
jgi:hypothetical protein